MKLRCFHNEVEIDISGDEPLDRLCESLEQWRSSTIHDRNSLLFQSISLFSSSSSPIERDDSLPKLKRLCCDMDEVLVVVRSSINEAGIQPSDLEPLVSVGLHLVDAVATSLLRSESKQLSCFQYRIMDSLLCDERLLLIFRFLHDTQRFSSAKWKCLQVVLPHLLSTLTEFSQTIRFSVPVVATALGLDPSEAVLPLFSVSFLVGTDD